MNFFKKIINFIQESIAELKKVTWPTRDDVVAQTVVVLVSLIIVSVFLALVDFGGYQVVDKIINYDAIFAFFGR